ncbi:MAG: Hsp20/alpha crystallin family protein [Chloroflexi bacterium]|nr:Hsp20/alpha crystallin family protein [Chloroflexota bacterium]
MTYFIAPTPYRMARRWARMAECEQPEPSHRYMLSVDLREQDDAYMLNALVPGLKAEDLNIQVLEDVVTIEGEFKGDENEYLVRELPHGSFRRTLRLPAALDAEKAQARINEGVLTLTLPKAESARPKTVKIAVK